MLVTYVREADCYVREAVEANVGVGGVAAQDFLLKWLESQ